MEVLPAIIAVDQEQLDHMLNKVKDFVAYIMLDIMDGVFVPGRSLDFDYRLPADPRYQTHLMVEDPIRHMSRFPVEADTAIIHIESVNNISKVVSVTHDQGIRTFLAINPETPVDAVTAHLSRIDGILVMTVQPGRYGSRFLPWCLEKVKALRTLDDELVIEVDGGMNPETATMAIEMGADAVAVGSYIFSSDDPLKAFISIVEAAQSASHRAWRRK